jgi:hypothetical protein
MLGTNPCHVVNRPVSLRISPHIFQQIGHRLPQFHQIDRRRGIRLKAALAAHVFLAPSRSAAAAILAVRAAVLQQTHAEWASRASAAADRSPAQKSRRR